MRRFATTFACWWLLFATFGALWLLATPIGASPDAPAQVARAVSVARGQWLGPAVAGKNSAITTYVTVPATYVLPESTAHCYMFREHVTAACAPPLRESPKLEVTTTHVGRYPPAYYFIAGLPSLLTDRVAGIYLMEAASVLLCAAMLALAASCARLWSSSRLLLVGTGLAATPMALFLSSQVNPSGLEIAAAIAVWASASVLVAEHLTCPPKGLVAVLAASAAVLVWARPTALLWPLLVVAVLAPAAWRQLRRPVLLRRDVVAGSCLVSVAALGALGWVVLAHGAAVVANFGPLPASSSFWHTLSFVVGRLPSLAQQAVGNFGWLDTPLPWPAVAGWLCAAALTTAAGAWSGGRKALVPVALSLLASLLLPVVLLVAAAHSYGYVGQGRYFLAIWAGTPIAAAGLGIPPARRSQAARAARAVVRATVPISGTVVAGLQAFSYYWALRRYIVGIPGPLSWSGSAGARTSDGQLEWHPPLPGWWLVAIFVLVCLVYAVAMVRAPAGAHTSASRHSGAYARPGDAAAHRMARV